MPFPEVLQVALNNLELFREGDCTYLENMEFVRKTPRLIRSEYREAIYRVCSYLIKHMNLHDFKVGIIDVETQTVSPITVKTIANKTQLSVYRVWRVIAHLKQSGYLKCTKRFKVNATKTSFSGLASVKELSKAFFFALGVKAKRIQVAIDYAKKLFDRATSREKRKSRYIESVMIKSAEKAMSNIKFEPDYKFENSPTVADNKRANEILRYLSIHNRPELDRFKEYRLLHPEKGLLECLQDLSHA